jgi:hypothetical protein
LVEFVAGVVTTLELQQRSGLELLCLASDITRLSVFLGVLGFGVRYDHGGRQPGEIVGPDIPVEVYGKKLGQASEEM